MEDLKQIQEFFSKPLNENVFVEAFKLQKALKGMGYDVKVKAVDDFGKNVFEIYFNNPADADDSIYYDVEKLGYDNVRVFANPQESIDEATKEEETEFHTKLDKLVHDTFGKRKGEMEEYNTGIYYDPAKDTARPKAKEASKSALERVKDMIKKIASEQKMGEALADYEEKEANYDELYSDYKYKVDEVKPKKGHGEKISKEIFAKLKGKTISYKGADYKVIDSDEAVIKLKHKDGDTKTINLKQFNDSGLIDEIIETVLLGRQLNEKKLCKKGEAYRKRRMAAGEKSSAYLSGRAVKVCKGQISGKKRKKRRKKKKWPATE